MFGQALALVLGIGFITLQVKSAQGRVQPGCLLGTCGAQLAPYNVSYHGDARMICSLTLGVRDAHSHTDQPMPVPTEVLARADWRAFWGGAGQLGGAAPAGGNRLRRGSQRVR